MKEVIKKIKEMGFEVEVGNVSTIVLRNNKIVAWLVKDHPYTIDTAYRAFRELNHYTKEKLFNLLLELYQEPEYYWKLKGLGKLGGGVRYLNHDTEEGNYFIDTKVRRDWCETQFTKREFEEIKKELGFTLEFEPVEVE